MPAWLCSLGGGEARAGLNLGNLIRDFQDLFFPKSSSFLWLEAQFSRICSVLFSHGSSIRDGGGERLRRGIQETGENGRKGRWRRAERIVPGLSIRNLSRVGAARTRRARAGLEGGNCGFQVPRNAFTLWFWSPHRHPSEVSRLHSAPLQNLRDYTPSLLPRFSSPPLSLPARPPPFTPLPQSARDTDTSGDTASVVHWRLEEVPIGAETRRRETQLQPKPGA